MLERLAAREAGTLPAGTEVTPSAGEANARFDELRQHSRVERARLEAFFDFACFDHSFVDLRRRTRQDLEVTGNAFWEVLRDGKGDLARFVYVPSYTVRLLRNRAVAEAIEALPEHAKPALENCIIDVQPIPSDEDLAQGGVSPLILGLFRGHAVDERSPVEAADHQTAHITLYQNNLERFASTREELLEEIRITVLHEVGHLLGLDEDELYERGLD